MSTWTMMNIQDANSPIMENLILFHDYSLMILMIITIIITYIMFTLIYNKFINKFIMNNQLIELIWTFIPMMILFLLAIPSLKILYLTDEMLNPLITIKSIGHQWYWSYEYSDFKNVEFNSFMIPSKDLMKSNFRLLDVDNKLILPMKNKIRILTNSTDVIHSWTVPSLGIKIDSIPGRINQSNLLLSRPGIYFGQCSEICGINHSFMPIVIESTSNKNFIKWIKSI